MSNYSLIAFSAGDLDAVANRWRELAGPDVYEVELVPLFEYCRENRSFRQGYGFVRGLQDEGTGEVDAILETVPSPARRRTKLLKIWVSPAMWPTASGPDATDELARVYVGAYVAVVREALEEGLGEVKMYGRDETGLKLLTAVCDVWDSALTGWVAKMEGRWLSLQQPTSK